MVNVLCFISCLCISGCGQKDLFPPPVNPTPHDKIEMILTLSGKGDVSRYRINAQIEYGNLSKRCSNIHSFEGGWVEYPHGYISVDNKNNSIEIYRDYYQSMGECSWRFLGLGIDIYDENGRLADGGLPADSLQTGYSVKLHCNFSNKWSGNCLPGNAGRVRTDLTVDISIH
jgi:hypothetical protein